MLGFDNDSLKTAALAFVEKYGFHFSNGLPRLQLTNEGLVLLTQNFKPLTINFSKVIQKRRHDMKSQGLIQACKPKAGISIIDATGGWGRDAAMLAFCNAQVLILERNPVMAALLQDALLRNELNLPLSFKYTDAIEFLSQLKLGDYPDVIYLDPMHPLQDKSALVKKEMQWLHKAIGPDLDAFELLKIALQRALKKVVIKWPKSEPPLIKPTYAITGNTIRFDVYSRCP